MRHPHFANITDLQCCPETRASDRGGDCKAARRWPASLCQPLAFPTFMPSARIVRCPLNPHADEPPLTPSHPSRPCQVRGFCASGPRESLHARGRLGLNFVRFHIVNEATIPAHGPLHFTSHPALLIELRHDTSVPFGPGPKPATYPPLGVRRRAAIRRALRPGELAADSRNPDRTS